MSTPTAPIDTDTDAEVEDPTLDAALALMAALDDDPREIGRAIAFITRVAVHELPDPHDFAVGMAATAEMAGKIAHGNHEPPWCNPGCAARHAGRSN